MKKNIFLLFFKFIFNFVFNGEKSLINYYFNNLINSILLYIMYTFSLFEKKNSIFSFFIFLITLKKIVNKFKKEIQ